MAIALVILSILAWLSAIALLFRDRTFAPVAAYFGLFMLSLATVENGEPLLPLNGTILTGWLCITLAVMTASFLQSAEIRNDNAGMGYMTAGAITGMAVGLLGYNTTADISILYAIMIIATLTGTFFGYLIFSRTPQGRSYGIRSSKFTSYLLAKGFPTAITVMIAGVALVLVIAVKNSNTL